MPRKRNLSQENSTRNSARCLNLVFSRISQISRITEFVGIYYFSEHWVFKVENLTSSGG